MQGVASQLGSLRIKDFASEFTAFCELLLQSARPMILKKRKPKNHVILCGHNTRKIRDFSSELSQDCSKQKTNFQSS